MRTALFACLLSLTLTACIDRRPSLDGDNPALLDATPSDATPLDAAVPDSGLPDSAPPDPIADATPPDAALPDAAEPEPEPAPDPEPAAEPEPPIDTPERIRLVGFSADARYLFIMRLDPPSPPDDRIAESGQLERHDVATGEQVVIDTHVIPSISNQRGVLFDARGESVVYAKRSEGLLDNETWLEPIAPVFHRWTPDRRVAYGRATRVMLDTGGRHLLAWPWDAEFIEVLTLATDRVLRLPIPRRFAHWENSVVLGTDAAVEVLDLGTADRRVLADNAALIRVAGAFALLNEDERFAVHDLESGVRLATPLEAPRGITFFSLDRALGQAVVGIGNGAYGAIRTWALDSDVVTDVAMPDPRASGGQALATNARLHADGLVYYPRATWVGRDMWDRRDGVATLIQRNNCVDRALPGRVARLLVDNETGCSSFGPHALSLYDEASMTVRPTGILTRGVSALLADGRVVFSDSESGLGMIWDIDAESVEPLGRRLHSAQVRRDATWMIGSLSGDDRVQRALVVLHPGGITEHAQDGAVTAAIATDDWLAWVVQTDDGDALHLEALDDMR